MVDVYNFYKIVKSCIIEMRLVVLGQRLNFKISSNIKIQNTTVKKLNTIKHQHKTLNFM